MATRHFIRRGAVLRWAQASALLFFSPFIHGCQWVLTDLDPAADAAEDHAPAQRDDGGARNDGSLAGEDGGAVDEQPNGGDAQASRDANGSLDAAVDQGKDAGGAASDASSMGPDALIDPAPRQDASMAPLDATMACTALVTWYEDDDQDGYGRASSEVTACPAPARGTWSRTAGDCNDDDGRVHPDQQDYFRAPYRTPEGAESFDYDCSGNEEGNGAQAIFDGCGVLNLVACAGGGYMPVPREGASNPACGSDQLATCEGTVLGTLVCNPDTRQVVEAYWCR